MELPATAQVLVRMERMTAVHRDLDRRVESEHRLAVFQKPLTPAKRLNVTPREGEPRPVLNLTNKTNDEDGGTARTR